MKKVKLNKVLQLALMVGTAALLISPTRAQDHAPLELSSTLGINEIIDSALMTVPESLETSARQAQARDFQDIGKGWIAGVPNLQLGYLDDGLLDDQGQEEFAYGLQLPLWWPGQRQAAQTLGQRYTEQADKWEKALTWQVAGRVRSVLAAIAAAELGLSLQTRAVADAERMRDVTATLFEAGEVARLDMLQAETLLHNMEADLLQAEASMVDAERAYSVLTGLHMRPEQAYTETRTSQEDIEPDHPYLVFLRSGVDLAEANIRQSENIARGNPTLTLGANKQRGTRADQSIDSIELQMSIPIGGGRYVSAQSSSARRAKVDAEVVWQNAYIQLNQALHEVEHDLFVLSQEEPLRRSQMEISRERFDLALTAFEVGEINLVQVVVAQQEARESERAHSMLLMERERLITEFNQLIGVMP